MKNRFKHILLAAAVSPGLVSCLEEYTPTEYATQEQVEASGSLGLSNAVSAYMNTYSTYDYFDVGFPAMGIWRDCMTADMPVYSAGYDYFSYPANCTYLGATYSSQGLFWERYYGLIQKANLVMESAHPESSDDERKYAANALAYRAYAYLEMAQWYEYHKTDIAALDAQAEAAKIKGLTVPIVTEKTTEAESRHNPRVPYYTIYRFILQDLSQAETYMTGERPLDGKNNADLGVIFGLKARLWLYLGTRFSLHEEDLSEMLSHEADADIPYTKLGVNSAQECFVKAADYARRAINQSGTPLTESQWFDPKTGFNTVNQAWMWAVIITPDNGLATSLTWQSFVSFMSPETTYGIANSDFESYRLIDARLFGEISDSDWRKTTWIAPEDAGLLQAFNTKYARGTSMGYDEWKEYASYCGFKFHPNAGDRNASTSGNAVSIPLMRVEEMYLIEAEASGRAYGVGNGRALLESFMNTYRYTDGTYVSTGAGLEGFIDDVFTQKRIEFWGEGIILWDYRRLEKPITKGYPGTNWPSSYRFNSMPNAVAPWSTLCLPQEEKSYNDAIILNPDPSHGNMYSVWSED